MKSVELKESQRYRTFCLVVVVVIVSVGLQGALFILDTVSYLHTCNCIGVARPMTQLVQYYHYYKKPNHKPNHKPNYQTKLSNYKYHYVAHSVKSARQFGPQTPRKQL